MRGDNPAPGFIADLEFLENRDLDLSVRIGGMLAFNALMVTIGTHPISALLLVVGGSMADCEQAARLSASAVAAKRGCFMRCQRVVRGLVLLGEAPPRIDIGQKFVQ